MRLLSRKEEMILLTIWRLGDEAYGLVIGEKVAELSGKYWSIGAVYDVLDRLSEKGYIDGRLGEASNDRGGKRKKYYKISLHGIEALKELNAVHEQMWNGLPSIDT